MITKLSSLQHEQVMRFLAKDAAFNLFIIGDIEAFGYDTEFQEVWGDFSDAGELRGVLLRYYASYLPYGVAGFDVDGFADIMGRDKHLQVVNGKAEIVEKFASLPQLVGGKKEDLYFAQLEKLGDLTPSPDDVERCSRVKKATLEDLDRILELRSQIPSFYQSPNNRDNLFRSMKEGVSRTFYVEDEHGRMVSAASTAAENSLSAMVVSVCTLPECRKQGLASLCMYVLCDELLLEGRSLCLFYNNPSAGAIYKRLGFRDIGRWRMYKARK